MSIEDVRARIRDRQLKAGARGRDETIICLDVELVAELEDLQADLDLTESVDGDDTKLDQLRTKITEAEAKIKAASLRLVFRSVGSVQYQALLNKHPDANDGNEPLASFQDELVDACLIEIWSDDQEVHGLTWTELRPELTYGEWELIVTKVLALNRVKIDIPFSLRPSGKTRS